LRCSRRTSEIERSYERDRTAGLKPLQRQLFVVVTLQYWVCLRIDEQFNFHISWIFNTRCKITLNNKTFDLVAPDRSSALGGRNRGGSGR